MIKIYSIEEAKKWDELVRTFANYDVYYLSGYVKAFQIHGDGEPQLFYYNSNEDVNAKGGLRGIYVYMKRMTAIEGMYDSITPYGYGGFLIEGLEDENSDSNQNSNSNEGKLRALWTAYVRKMKEYCGQFCTLSSYVGQCCFDEGLFGCDRLGQDGGYGFGI